MVKSIHRSLGEIVNQNKLKIVNMNIKTFRFNPIQVNTYVLSDETGEGIIIDPGNCNVGEDEQLREYIAKSGIKIKFLVNTHPHIDHIAGNPWCVSEYHIPVYMHEGGLPIYKRAYAYAIAFGMSVDEMPEPSVFLEEGDEVKFGNTSLSVFYTPGHCEGSICLYSKNEKVIFTGDLIFELSVGRSDLPTGNEAVLQESIREKILTLDDDVVILSGHGSRTTVGRERSLNPFIH